MVIEKIFILKLGGDVLSLDLIEDHTLHGLGMEDPSVKVHTCYMIVFVFRLPYRTGV